MTARAYDCTYLVQLISQNPATYSVVAILKPSHVYDHMLKPLILRGNNKRSGPAAEWSTQFTLHTLHILANVRGFCKGKDPHPDFVSFKEPTPQTIHLRATMANPGRYAPVTRCPRPTNKWDLSTMNKFYFSYVSARDNNAEGSKFSFLSHRYSMHKSRSRQPQFAMLYGLLVRIIN